MLPQKRTYEESEFQRRLGACRKRVRHPHVLCDFVTSGDICRELGEYALVMHKL